MTRTLILLIELVVFGVDNHDTDHRFLTVTVMLNMLVVLLLLLMVVAMSILLMPHHHHLSHQVRWSLPGE